MKLRELALLAAFLPGDRDSDLIRINITVSIIMRNFKKGLLSLRAKTGYVIGC